MAHSESIRRVRVIGGEKQKKKKCACVLHNFEIDELDGFLFLSRRFRPRPHFLNRPAKCVEFLSGQLIPNCLDSYRHSLYISFACISIYIAKSLSVA